MIVRQGAPFVKSQMNVTYISAVKLIALIPAVCAALVFYGLRAFILISFCALLFTGCDEICNLIKGVKQPRDLSSFVNGTVFALLLPPDTPLNVAAVGILFGSIAIRQLSGGRGSEFINPAAAGRIFVRIVFPLNETAFSVPGDNRLYLNSLLFGSEGFDPVNTSDFHITEILAGRYPAFLGTSCSIMILAALIYMIAKKAYKYYIPLSYILTLTILLLLRDHMNGTNTTIVYLLTSGVLFTCVYLMCDEGTFLSFGPMAVLEAVFCAVFTFLISFKGTGIDVVVIPFVLTSLLTGVIRYAGTIMKTYTEDRMRAES